MSQAKLFPYIDAPTKSTPPYLNDRLDLQEIFSMCVQELTLQQSKRDQLIAFYLTITGLVSTYLFSADVIFAVRMVILGALFVIGCIWSTIAIRYKIYKESYWMCCKTISSLYTVDREKIDKPLLQHTFYTVMKKCYKSVPKDNEGRPQVLKFAKKNITSAEFLMFFTLALLAALSGSAALLLLLLTCKFGWMSYVIVTAFFAVFLFMQTINYNKAVISLFDVMRDETDKSFNKVFEKAWLIHFFS